MKDSDSRILLCIVIKNGCCIIFRSIIDAICFPVWISLRENGIQAIRNIFFSIIDGENYRPLISCKFLIIIYLHLSSNVVYLLNLMQHIATVENDLAFQALFVVRMCWCLINTIIISISFRNSSKLLYWFSAILCSSRNGS